MTTPLDPTQFTRESAERIARVVRAAELETPAAASLQWMPVFPPQNRKVFRLATYSTNGGTWSKWTTNHVHDYVINKNLQPVPQYNSDGTPKMTLVLNIFQTLPPNYDAVRYCAYAKLSGTNVLMIAEC